MAGVGDAWGTRESMLHPRDSHGRFRSKWKMSTAVVDRLMKFLGSFNPKMFGNDEEGGGYVQELGRSGRKGYGGNAALGKFLRGTPAVQAKLRSGDTSSPEVKAIDDSMTPLPDDLILTQITGPESWGLTPETIGQIEEYTGHLVADKGYTPASVGTPLPHAGPAITMTIATPAGTKAAIPRSNGGREVILDRDQPLRITKVDSDGKGGFYVLAVAEAKGAPGTKRTTKLGGKPPAPEPGLPQPQQTPGAPAAPGAPEAPGNAAPVAPTPGVLVPQKKIGRPAGPPPAVRNEGHVAESIGGKPVPQGQAPNPDAPQVPAEPIPQQPGLPDKPAPDPRSTFRGAFKKADLNSPSEGKRRQQFNEAYLGAATGKKTPQEAVDTLEHHIALNEKILQSDKEDGTDSGPLPDDIKKQKDLAQLIKDHFGLEGAKAEKAPAKKATPTSKAAVPPVAKKSVQQIDAEVARGERERKGAIRKEMRERVKPPEPSKEDLAHRKKIAESQAKLDAQQAEVDAKHDAAAKIVADKWLADAGISRDDLSDFEKTGLKLVSSNVASKKISEPEGRRRLAGGKGNLAKIGANAPAKRPAAPKKAAGPLNDDLSNATIAQLREEAKKRGIKIPSSARRKEDIRQVVLGGKKEATPAPLKKADTPTVSKKMVDAKTLKPGDVVNINGKQKTVDRYDSGDKTVHFVDRSQAKDDSLEIVSRLTDDFPAWLRVERGEASDADLKAVRDDPRVPPRIRTHARSELARRGAAKNVEAKKAIPTAPKAKDVPIEVVKSGAELDTRDVMNGRTLTPAGRSALEALGPAGHAKISAIPTTEGKVRAAVAMLQVPNEPGRYTNLEDLRSLIGNQVPREELDKVLRDMSHMPGVDIVPQSYDRGFRSQHRIDNAVIIGGQENNLIRIEGKGPETPTPEAPKAPTPSAPEKAAGTAKGKLTAARVAPGTRILVRKDAKGEWAPTSTKTGATAITVTSKDASTAGGRRGSMRRSGSAGYVITGKDDNGNEITVKAVTPSQTFWLHERKEVSTPVAKKAVPKKTATRKSLTPKSAEALQDRMLAEKPWTDGQRKSLTRYASMEFDAINSKLRGTKVGEGMPTGTPIWSNLDDTITEVKGAMRPLPEDVNLHRRVGFAAFGVEDVEGLRALQGKTLQDKAFMSTTIASRADLDKAVAKGRPVVMDIHAPAGSSAAYIGKRGTWSRSNEMLLDAGTKYRIDNIIDEPDGTVTVKATVLPDSAPTAKVVKPIGMPEDLQDALRSASITDLRAQAKAADIKVPASAKTKQQIIDHFVQEVAKREMQRRGMLLETPPKAPTKAVSMPQSSADLLKAMKADNTRPGAHKVIEGLTVPQLKQFAKDNNITVSGSKAHMQATVVDWAVGRKLDSDAILRAGSGNPYRNPATGKAALAATPLDITRGFSLRGPNSVTFEQQGSLTQYKGTAFDNINSALRRSEGNVPLTDTGFFGDYQRGAIADIDAVMDHSALTSDVEVFRGIRKGRDVFGPAWDGPLTGAEWTEHAFLSTTTEESVAKGSDWGSRFYHPVTGAIFKITAPKGTKGVTLSDERYESEILFQRGLRLKVVSDTGPGKNRVIVMEVVKR